MSKQADKKLSVIDIGVNLSHKSYHKNWRQVVQRAIDAGVDKIILTGTSIDESKKCLQMAQQWYDETNCPNLYTTIGIHPHYARAWNEETLDEMRKMLNHPLAVAVGECGLDYNRNFSSKMDQKRAFRCQVKLAIELNMPIFLHEREAYEDFIEIIDELEQLEEQLQQQQQQQQHSTRMPPMVVHCFTGTKEEALSYIKRGYYIGFTGIICKEGRGKHLRDIIPELPLSRLMVETDAPYMGFKGRRPSEPADCINIAEKLSETIKVPLPIVCESTTMNAMEFFGI